MKKYHTIVVGGGPGGLACATKLAKNGVEVLLLERNKTIGPKICAGGVTWSGLSQLIPAEIIERSFPEQHIKTKWQELTIRSPDPIICTVDRAKLGAWMAEKAQAAGVEIQTQSPVIKISNDCVQTRNGPIGYKYLVGADGSSSMVRRFLGCPAKKLGVGINVHIPQKSARMEWHLDSDLFNTGYAWIFPHRHTVAVGAYAYRKDMAPKLLKKKFYLWAEKHAINLNNYTPAAALINFDYQGFNFGNIFLVGDAAGLASGLTGEGIYPAIISGEAAARTIVDKKHRDERLIHLVKKHTMHTRVLELAGKNRTGCRLIMESLVFALKKRFIHFSALEMGDNL
jgi:geranylgeranyl reductase